MANMSYSKSFSKALLKKKSAKVPMLVQFMRKKGILQFCLKFSQRKMINCNL